MKVITTDKKFSIITLDGYKTACFIDNIDTKNAISIIKEHKLDIAILTSKLTGKKEGHLLTLVTYKNINLKRLVDLLVEQGKKNDLFWEYKNNKSDNKFCVCSANLKMFK